MLVTFPIRLPFLIIARIFRAMFNMIPKTSSSNVETVTTAVALESSVAEKTPVVVAAVAKENEEAGKALMEKASIMVRALSTSSVYYEFFHLL